MKKRIAIIVGTRPEVIKMMPVVKQLAASSTLKPFIISTGQQRELSRQAMESVGMKADVNLALMTPGQDLAALTARCIEGLSMFLKGSDAVLVHGDTTTALSGALASFYAKIPLGHVEAGLRTHDMRNTWPEEMNRRLIDQLSKWCFAPTQNSVGNLLSENLDATGIHETGNTGVDALFAQLKALGPQGRETSTARMILVTLHRRESFGEGIENVCRALLRLVRSRKDVHIGFPVHLNPDVRTPVLELLANNDRILLKEAFDYRTFVGLMRSSHFILTDSGGVQEEAPSLGKPVLVTRAVTERPEGLAAGTSVLVGTDPKKILAECSLLLDDWVVYERRAAKVNPYGDGRAARRIVKRLEQELS